jgi:outer membrane protein insertion porin family
MTNHINYRISADRGMDDLTGKLTRRLPICLAIPVAMVGMLGCQQFGGTTAQPFATTVTQQGQPVVVANTPPAATANAAAVTSPAAGWGQPDGMLLAQTTASPATVADGEHRHVAFQYPIANSPGIVAPDGSVTSVPGGVGDPFSTVDPYGVFQGPRERMADLELSGYPARTGRIMLGGAVNSDAGVTGQLTIDERNFDITRFPRSFQDLFSGTAFRGRGQTLRLEAAPGNQFQRYMLTFAEPSVFNRPVSFSTSLFLYDRRFNDWDEQRLGGRLGLGYRITPDLSLSVGVNGQNVEISNTSVAPGLVPQLDRVRGDNDLYSGEISLRHDTRNSPILASRGHFFEFKFEEAFGEFDYARFESEFRQYWTLFERADGSGKQTLSYSTQVGFSGEDTPIFENYFAGGYATIRGFNFRGASPVDAATGVELGGRFQWLNSVEYMFPITADDAFRGVAFVDFGTVEEEITIDTDNFRVAPGLGLRVAIPMLGPAPLAFDFAFPVAKADTDDERVFSFYMSMIR